MALLSIFIDLPVKEVYEKLFPPQPTWTISGLGFDSPDMPLVNQNTPYINAEYFIKDKVNE